MGCGCHLIGALCGIDKVEQDDEDHGKAQDDDGKPAELVVAHHGLPQASPHEVEQREVDAGDEEEGTAHVFDERGMEPPEAGLMGGEASRGEGGHGVTYGIEHTHASAPEEQGAAASEQQVDEPEGARGVLDAWTELVDGHACDFGTEHVGVARREAWDQGQREHDDAEASYPLCHAAPEQDAVGLKVDVVHDGAACGGEARHGLDEGVGHGAEAPTEQIGQHADERKQQPCDGDDQEAFAMGEVGMVAMADSQQAGAYGQTDDGGHQQGHEVLVGAGQVVVECY